MNMRKKLISIVTPCFNEELGVTECHEAIRDVFARELPDYDFEHIFCDNASTDRTVEILKDIASTDGRVKIIVNSRNFGILKNTYNGVMSATGDAVLLFMPVDLQDPPDLIPAFVRHWEQGNEIVYGIRAQREEPFLLASARRAYYRLLSRLTYVDYPPNVGDFQLVDKVVHDAMKKVDDAQPFMRLMTFDCGFRSIGVEYTWRARKYGKSQNRLAHMLDQGLNGIISFSGAPMRAALLGGFVISAVSMLYAVAVLLLALFGKVQSPAGVPTVIVALFFFGGVQLFFMGVLGEYVLAIYNQVRKKPLVVERERVNFTPHSAQDSPGPKA
jgi:glycosyltransferase involved in cell wall biosynthesis